METPSSTSNFKAEWIKLRNTEQATIVSRYLQRDLNISKGDKGKLAEQKWQVSYCQITFLSEWSKWQSQCIHSRRPQNMGGAWYHSSQWSMETGTKRNVHTCKTSVLFNAHQEYTINQGGEPYGKWQERSYAHSTAQWAAPKHLGGHLEAAFGSSSSVRTTCELLIQKPFVELSYSTWKRPGNKKMFCDSVDPCHRSVVGFFTAEQEAVDKHRGCLSQWLISRTYSPENYSSKVMLMRPRNFLVSFPITAGILTFATNAVRFQRR